MLFLIMLPLGEQITRIAYASFLKCLLFSNSSVCGWVIFTVVNEKAVSTEEGREGGEGVGRVEMVFIWKIFGDSFLLFYFEVLYPLCALQNGHFASFFFF